MNHFKIGFSLGAAILLVLFYTFLIPSLMGLLISVLLVVFIYDLLSRQYRQAARNFNAAALITCQHQGVLRKVAAAFSKSGALQAPCYEYARRLTMGEDPIDSAVRSRVPLRLTTAVALVTKRDPTARSAKLAGPSPRNNREIGRSDNLASLPYAQVLYVVMTAIVTCSMLNFSLIFIVPTFEVMSSEFDIEMPSRSLLSGLPTRIMLLVVLGFLAMMTVVVNWGGLFFTAIPRWLPVSPRFIEDRSDTLHGLADAIDSGMTVDQALELGSIISLKSREKTALRRANQLIHQGTTPAEALYRSGWLNAREHDWIKGASADRGADLLRTIADQRVRDAHANFRTIMTIATPVIILMLGFAVLSFAYGFISVLASLVSGLAH